MHGLLQTVSSARSRHAGGTLTLVFQGLQGCALSNASYAWPPAQLAARLLARMARLRHLHLAISYVPSLPQLARLLHLELRAIKFDGVQARPGGRNSGINPKTRP